MKLQHFIGNYLEPFAYLVYFIAVWIANRKTTNKDLSYLTWYYLLAFLLMLVISIMIGTTAYDTVWLYHLHLFCTLFFLTAHFRKIFRSDTKKKSALWISLLVGAYLLASLIIGKEFRFFNSIGYCFVSGCVTIFVFMYFHQLLSNVTSHSIFQDFNFWLSSGFLMYFVGSFFIFISYNYLTRKIIQTYTYQERDLLTGLWGLHNVLLFVAAIALLFGSLWIVYQKKSTSL